MTSDVDARFAKAADEMTSTAPSIVPKPGFARFLWERDLNDVQAAVWLETSPQNIRRWRLPFGHPERSVPTAGFMERIVTRSGGALGPPDFYEPHLSRAPSTDGSAEAAAQAVAP